MRYLHPVQRHEKFVASGRYQFYRSMLLTDEFLPKWERNYGKVIIEATFGDDADSDIGRWYQGLVPLNEIEEWTIHELPDQSRLIRCDRYSPKHPASASWLGEILQGSGGKTERIDMRCYQDRKLISEASFLFFEESVLIGRKYMKEDGTLTERDQSETPLPAGYLVDSGMFTLTRGLTAQEMLKRRQSVAQAGVNEMASDETAQSFTIFYPEEPEYEDIDTPFSILLKGQTLSCEIKHYEVETMMVNGQNIQGDVYSLTYTTPFDQSRAEWTKYIFMDKRGIPLRYPYHFAYTNRLEQYAHRPEPVEPKITRES